MRYRPRNSKIKAEHSILEGLGRFLEERVQPLDYVETIVPGVLRRSRGRTPGLQVRFQYATRTGAKLIAQNGSTVQEVFVVTRDPERLRAVLEGTAE